MQSAKVILSTKLLFCFFILLWTPYLLHAKTVDKKVTESIYTISNNLFYYYENALTSLDSLRNNLSESELELYKPYFQYADAVSFYQLGKYNEAIQYIDSALVSFCWEELQEWEARCFLIAGFVAEAIKVSKYELEFYELSNKLSKENRTKGLALYGLARSKRHSKVEWENYYFEGQHYLKQEKSHILDLYQTYSAFYFYPDSSSLISTLLKTAKQFEDIDLQVRASDCYKLVAYGLFKQNKIDEALEFVDKSIFLLTNSELIQLQHLSSVLYLRGILYQSQDNMRAAKNDFHQAISIHNELGNEHSNYYIYRSLFRQDTLIGNLESALLNNNKALACFRKNTDLNDEINTSFLNIVQKRATIQEEIIRTKRRTINIGILLSFIITLSVLLLIRLNFKRIKINRKYNAIQRMVSTSVSDKREVELKASLDKTQEEITRRIDKHLSKDREFIEYVNENLAATILNVNERFPDLTDSELKCACLILLGCSSKDLEDLLCVKYETVRTYRSRLRRSIGIEDRNVNLKVELMNLISDG